MMYKAKVAVCSDIRTKHSTQSEHHVEFLNINLLKKGISSYHAVNTSHHGYKNQSFNDV